MIVRHRSAFVLHSLLAFLVAITMALTPGARAFAQSSDDEDHAEVRKNETANENKAASKNKADKKKSTAKTEDKADQRNDTGKKSDDGDNKSDKKDKDDKETDEPVVTHGTVAIDGKEIVYTATAGKMVMKTDEGDPKANVFFIAYTKDGPQDDDGDEQDNGDDGDDGQGARNKFAGDKASKRPVTFCFNGGPGSSSVWLHLGMLGPVRVKLGSDAETLPPPHELMPNEYSLLDVTDLVFIDPVSTGFSRPVKGEDKRQFHGYDEDLRSVGQFIHDYATKYGRWDSPKFLIGESYGGLRAAGLSGVLQDRYHMYLNGIVLVSAVVDFQTLVASGNNDIAYALFLPSYAATAWYHEALSDEMQELSLEEIQEQAERFALGPYLRALAQGDSLNDERREQVVERMAELTGLSTDYIEASNLRVPMYRFGKQLLHDRGLIIGRFDSRYDNFALDPIDPTTDYDPSAAAVFGTFTSAMNEYLRSFLKVEEDRVYEILTDRVHPWDYSEFANRFVNASNSLREAMVTNPYLHVFAACGYYDLATPLAAMEYTRDHLNLPKEIRKNFTMDFYEAGHMMYAHEPSLAKLRKDLLKFYAEALKPLQTKADADE